MHGVDLANIYQHAAVTQQKNNPQEKRNIRASQLEQRPRTAQEAAAARTRNARVGQPGQRPQSAQETKTQNPAGKEPAPENKLTGRQGLPSSQKDPAGKAENQDDKNKTAQASYTYTDHSRLTANGIGQANSLGLVDRQRLAQQKKAKAKLKKKNLNYNRREVSSQVLRANKLGSAARALATARTKVGTLRRCVGTGQYDENELRIAIAHAESIVKTAKKKLSNLKEEQIKEKRVSREKQTNALKKNVKKQRVRAQRQKIKRELAIGKKQAERQMKAKELRCKQLKRRHRSEELGDVAEADMKYIKDMDRYRRYGTTEGSSRPVTDTTGTAAFEIGDSAMRLADLERTEQALKYEEQQMGGATFYDGSASGSIDYSVGDGTSVGGVSQEGGSPEGALADMGVMPLGGSVDLSL